MSHKIVLPDQLVSVVWKLFNHASRIVCLRFGYYVLIIDLGSAVGLQFGLVLGGALLRIYCEELLVTVRYPEYRQYAATTWRMIPYVF